MRDAAIRRVAAHAYEIPTDQPEADGTLSWDKTTILIVEIEAGGQKGLGYTYADAALVPLIAGKLASEVTERDAFDIAGIGDGLWRSVRNLGRGGLAATAISAIDIALWDLKAKLLDLSLATLLGRRRENVPIYGSGGFTTYSNETLQAQLAGWVERDGCRWVKMKVGTHPAADPARIEAARRAIGDRGLFIDANGAFAPNEAVAFAQRVAEQRLSWFEEPVSSDDVDGLFFVRDHALAGVDVAAGEYGYTLDDFARLLQRPSVDVLQADVTRCGGISGFLQVGALCEARHVDLSGHCAPAAHRHVACVVPRLRHLEWFHDHVRIEHLFFDGAPQPQKGAIAPDGAAPGLGLRLKERDVERFRVA